LLASHHDRFGALNHGAIDWQDVVDHAKKGSNAR
jgi:hypothetical protein